MTRSLHAAFLLAALAVSAGDALSRTAANAPGGPGDSTEPYVQSVTDGYIDWGSGEVGAWGYAPRTTSSARETRMIMDMKILAEKRARERLLAIVRGARAGSEARVGDRPDLLDRVNGIAKAALVANERPTKGGLSYGVLVVAPLWGADGIAYSVYDGMVPRRETSGAAPSGAGAVISPGPPAEGPTGIVIDARGTGLRPALLPRILDDQGAVLFSAETVDRDAVKDLGMAAYVVEPAGASSLHERIGDRPLWVFAAKETGGATSAAQPETVGAPDPTPRQGRRPCRVKASGATGLLAADVVLGRSDAEKIRSTPGAEELLKRCRVVFIVEAGTGREG